MSLCSSYLLAAKDFYLKANDGRVTIAIAKKSVSDTKIADFQCKNGFDDCKDVLRFEDRPSTGDPRVLVKKSNRVGSEFSEQIFVNPRLLLKSFEPNYEGVILSKFFSSKSRILMYDGVKTKNSPLILVDLANSSSFEEIKTRNTRKAWHCSCFKKESINSLDLHDRDIVCLTKEIRILGHITSLMLQNNMISELPDELATLSSLEMLDLSGNRLERLPFSLIGLSRLKHLYLDRNILSNLPRSIGNLVNLQTLSVSSNFISELPREMGRLFNLSFLRVEGNILRFLPSELLLITDLKINIRDNPLISPGEQVSIFNFQNKYSGPSLKELAGRSYIKHSMGAESFLPKLLLSSLVGAEHCSVCKGPMIEYCMDKIVFVKREHDLKIPFSYKLCEAHWSDEKGRQLALFKYGNNEKFRIWDFLSRKSRINQNQKTWTKVRVF